jgi:5'-3' exonuclease
MSPLKSFCPETFDVDVSGKRQDWEGIVILPMVKFDIIEKSYHEYIDCVDESDRKRDIRDTSYIFSAKETRTIDI